MDPRHRRPAKLHVHYYSSYSTRESSQLHLDTILKMHSSLTRLLSKSSIAVLLCAILTLTSFPSQSHHRL
ncbi:hypothetical protein LguiA_026211 [Lonicera macranthoides]